MKKGNAKLVLIGLLAFTALAWLGLLKNQIDTTCIEKYSSYETVGDWHVQPDRNYVTVSEEGRYGMAAKDGTRKIKCTYEYLGAYDKDTGVIPCCLEGSYYYIDVKGNKKLVGDNTYQYLGSFGDGLAPAQRDGKYGYIDTEFHEQMFELDYAGAFANGVGAPAVPPVQKTAPVHVPPAQPIITPAVPPAVPQPPQQQTQESPKEEMSLLHLLTHYSKENKALYDQQKAAQKGKPKQAASKPSKPAKTERPANQSAKSQSFAVPGVEQRGSAPSFAIPGQSAPVVQPVIQTPPQPKPQIPVTPVVQQPAAVQPVQIPVQPPVQTIPMVQTGEKMDFGNTTILNGGGRIGETTVLNNASQQSRRIAPYLIRSRNHEEIAVNKPQFRIGKERSYVDYFIGDNPAISRSHATIITRENTYFIVDTNSTNHTYVDGKMIQPNTEVPIQQGTKIRLGNEDFEFKLR